MRLRFPVGFARITTAQPCALVWKDKNGGKGGPVAGGALLLEDVPPEELDPFFPPL